MSKIRFARKALENELDSLSNLDNIGSVVRRAQLTGSIAALWRGTETIIKDGYGAAQAAALNMSFDWDEVLLATAFPDYSDREAMKRSLLETADRNVESLFARVFQSYIPLSEKVYKTEALANGWIDNIINAGLASGASAKMIQSRIIDFINPNTPGGAKYAALRLARTEINNAYHAQSIDVNRDKPWNVGMTWRKSDTHKIVDLCDKYNAQIFPLDNVPDKPHPFCLCVVFPKLVSKDEFLQNLRIGSYDSWLDDKLNLSGVSPNMGRAG